MNLLEAIQNCGENWFRDKSWIEDSGTAYAIEDGKIVAKFDESYHPDHFFLSDVAGEWEIVTPEQVMKERK